MRGMHTTLILIKEMVGVLPTKKFVNKSFMYIDTHS